MRTPSWIENAGRSRPAALAVIAAVSAMCLLEVAGSVAPEGSPPAPAVDLVHGVRAEPVHIDVLANDLDPDGDTLTLVPDRSPTPLGGQLDCSTTCTYSPPDPLPRPEVRIDVAGYTVSDGTHEADAEVFIYFAARGPSPRIVQTLSDGTSPVEVDVVGAATHPGGAAMSVVPMSRGSKRGGRVDCARDLCRYTPPVEGLDGEDHFTYELTDRTYTVTGSAVVRSAAPAALDDEAVSSGDEPLEIDVLANDSSPRGLPLNVVAQSGARSHAGGTVDCSANSCTYTAPTPPPTHDGFDYRVSDGAATSTGTVSIAVSRCPDPTEALDDAGLVVGHDWVACSGPTSNGPVRNMTPLLRAIGNASFMLTSGTVDGAYSPNRSPARTSVPDRTVGHRGAHDVQVLRLDLAIPPGGGCLAFDFVFGSDEFPEALAAHADAFVAELDVHSWHVEHDGLVAPDNFAIGAHDTRVSVDALAAAHHHRGATGLTARTGTEYDGSTPRLRALTPVSAGAHSLYLSVFDAGDALVDSGVIIDGLRLLERC